MERSPKIALTAILSTALLIMPTVVSVLIGIYAPLPLRAGIAVLSAGGGIIFFALLFNLIYQLSLRRKILRISVRDRYDAMQKKLNEIRSNTERAKRKTDRTIVFFRLYAVILYAAVFLLASGAVFLMFTLCGNGELTYAVGSGVSLLIAVFLGLNIIGVLLPRNAQEPTPQEEILEKNEYPLLYESARRAADAVGYHGKFCLARSYRDENGVSVREEPNVTVMVPPVVTNVLTRGELYQIFLHEFAHVVNGDTKISKKFVRAINAFSTERHTFLKFLKVALFTAPYRILDDKLEDYRNCASLLKEQLADKAVNDYGNAKENIDGEVKSLLLARFVGFNLRHFDYKILESETPPEDYYERLEADFRAWCSENGEKEALRLKRELPARAASHPTLKMRMQAAGREEYDLTTAETDEAYRTETKKYVADCSQKRKGWEGYKEYRKENYLDSKQKLDEYESAEAHDFLMKHEAMSAYLLADDDKALALANDVLASDPDAPFANYTKGLILFERDEAGGIDALKKAVCSCTQISQTAAEIYGDACLDSGDEAIVAEMRREQPTWVQMNVDALLRRYKFGKLTNRSFTKTNLSKAETDALAPAIKRIGKETLDRVLLLRSVKKGEEIHVFVLFPKNNVNFEMLSETAGNFNAMTAYLNRKNKTYACLLTKRASAQAIAAMKCGLDLMKE